MWRGSGKSLQQFGFSLSGPYRPGEDERGPGEALRVGSALLLVLNKAANEGGLADSMQRPLTGPYPFPLRAPQRGLRDIPWAPTLWPNNKEQNRTNCSTQNLSCTSVVATRSSPFQTATQALHHISAEPLAVAPSEPQIQALRQLRGWKAELCGDATSP